MIVLFTTGENRLLFALPPLALLPPSQQNTKPNPMETKKGRMKRIHITDIPDGTFYPPPFCA